MSLSLCTRLNKIAERMNVCPIHGAPLLCGPCHFEWRGTDEEFRELWPLSQRVSPYFKGLTPSGRVCRTCGTDLWCRPCYETQARQIPVPDDLFTPEELARYTKLLGHMRLKPPQVLHHGQSSSANCAMSGRNRAAHEALNGDS
jgi:hypothetical protein